MNLSFLAVFLKIETSFLKLKDQKLQTMQLYSMTRSTYDHLHFIKTYDWIDINNAFKNQTRLAIMH